MTCGFKARTAPRQRSLKREMSLASWSTLLGTTGRSDGHSGLIQLFPCDMRDSLSTQSSPEPSTLKCKPQSSGPQWGWRHAESVVFGQRDPNSRWRPPAWSAWGFSERGFPSLFLLKTSREKLFPFPRAQGWERKGQTNTAAGS